MNRKARTSRIPGFYKLSIEDRLKQVQDFADLSDEDIQILHGDDDERLEQASRMIENVGGLFHLPLGFAANFRIDDRDLLIPLVIEEPSVVAACSNAARLMRGGEGIVTEATAPIMIAQIQVCDIPDLDAAQAALAQAADSLVAQANDSQPRLVARGGGARRLNLRLIPESEVGPMLIVHLLVDVCDAMGANLVNAMAETLAPRIADLTGGVVCLRILSNLADERLAKAEGRIPIDTLVRKSMGFTGMQVAERIVQASVFAEKDPYRAATHNKGIMNGVDAFLLATGQDWRAMEAGAHAYAAKDGSYTAMATWRIEGQELVGRITIPVQVGIVGGVTKVHPTVKVALKVIEAKRASDVGRIAAAVGLAQNLAAILALATEGIQRGHMSLHARNIAAAVGARDAEIDRVVAEMIRRKTFTHAAAESIFAEKDGTAASQGEGQPTPTLTLTDIVTLRANYWPKAEQIIEQVIPRADEAGALNEMMWYQLQTGGKRLRAVIPLAVFTAMGCPLKDAIPLAAAVELLHNATLIHNDAESATRRRRGKETVWVRYGLNQAINCGTAMHYAALQCLEHLNQPKHTVQAVNQMVLTQLRDVIEAQVEAVQRKSYEYGATTGDLLGLARIRTGGLFAIAVAGAAKLAGAKPPEVDTLRAIGGHLGIIFEVQDELLDIVGGKQPGRGASIIDGQVGLLISHAMEHSDASDKEQLRAILEKSPTHTDADDVSWVMSRLKSSGAIAFGVELIERNQQHVDELAKNIDHLPLQRLLAGISQIFLGPVLARVS